MRPASQERNNRISRNSSFVWLTAFILAVLVVATVSVAGTCIYNYAHRSDCQISLYDGQIKESRTTIKNTAGQKKTNAVIKSQATQYKGKQAKQQSDKGAFEVKDAGQIWKTETAVDLFKAEYKNDTGVVTVKSADGSKVIAPGTEGSYTFSLKNTSDVSADYKIWVEADLNSNIEGVPIQTRMSGSDGWLLGGKNTWKQAEALNGVATTDTVGAGKTADYTIYWKWPFEQGEDKSDTDLSNASLTHNMSYRVTIYTLAAKSASADTATDSPANTTAEGADQKNQSHSRNAVKTGDNTQIFLWVVVLAVSAGILMGLFILRKRKNNNKNEQNKSEQ